MIEILDKKKCSGCAACYNICPVKAIKMAPDQEGFFYPEIDEKVCIKCNQCEVVCPYQNRVERETDIRMCFAGYNKNDHERVHSSSGGIFVLLAKEVLDKGGIVFGAAYDDDFLVYHSAAENFEELKKLIGSKYLQSRIGDSFSYVRKLLNKGKQVLFVGTSCQIAGLRGYLKKDYASLVCVDFICLGIPSPKVWKDYLDTYFKGEEIQYVNFKNKNLGWHQFSLNIKTDKRNFCRNGRETLFFSGYFKHLYSRPSCSECIFKHGNRDSDITISDCWGYQYIAPELDDNRGLSSIECHSQKGLELFELIKDNLVWKNANIEDVLKYNSNYCTAVPMGEHRADFWRDYDRLDKDKLFKKYCSPEKTDLFKRIKNKVKIIVKKVVGKCALRGL